MDKMGYLFGMFCVLFFPGMAGVLAAQSLSCPAETIGGFPTTIAGDGGPVANARFLNPLAVASDTAGNLYIADTGNHRIRRLTPAGTIDTIVGSGAEGYSGDGGPATQAALRSPQGIAAGPGGILYVADTRNHVVRRIAADGTITTIAGTGQPGFFGDNGPARSALLYSPTGLFANADGSLLIADSGNDRIRQLDPDGNITTVAGSGRISSSGRDDWGDGGLATDAVLSGPRAVVRAPDGRIFVEDTDHSSLRVIDSSGTIASAPSSPGVFTGWGRGLTLDPRGYLIAASLQLVRIDSQGGTTPGGIVPGFSLAAIGDKIYGVIGGDNAIRVTSAAGYATLNPPLLGTPSFGDGGAATQAAFAKPAGVTVGLDGSIYVSDSFDQVVRRIAPDGTISRFAGTGQRFSSGNGGPAISAAVFDPGPLASDGAGNVYVGTPAGVRVINSSGIIRTIPGLPQTANPNWIAVDPQGRVYTYTSDHGSFWIYRTDDGGTFRQFSNLAPLVSGCCTDIFMGAALRADGSILFGHTFAPTFAAIAVLDPTGVRNAENLYNAFGRTASSMVFDRAGNLYFAEANGRIKRMTPGGIITTLFNGDLAGFAGEAGLNSARYGVSSTAIAIDPQGDLVVADGFSRRVRRVRVSGCGQPAKPIINTIFSAGLKGSGNDRSGFVSPGEIISIYGRELGPAVGVSMSPDTTNRYPFVAAGVRVLINGNPAPLLYVSATQINTIMPVETAGFAGARVQVEVNGDAGDAVAVSVTPSHPAVFGTLCPQLSNNPCAAMINQDGSINSRENPAPQGSVVAIFVTGLGLRDQPTVDGGLNGLPLAKPLRPVRITGGRTNELTYVGDAPGLVSGAGQVNFRVPILNSQTNFLTMTLSAPPYSNADNATFFFFVK